MAAQMLCNHHYLRSSIVFIYCEAKYFVVRRFGKKVNFSLRQNRIRNDEVNWASRANCSFRTRACLRIVDRQVGYEKSNKDVRFFI